LPTPSLIRDLIIEKRFVSIEELSALAGYAELLPVA
jgi:hypothetical protein